MVFNQSNWRYLIEWTFVYADKVSFNIPSVILQYLEYHRITANASTDYEDKVAKYARFLGLITAILTRKYEYIQALYVCNEMADKGSYLSGGGKGSYLSGGSYLNRGSMLSGMSAGSSVTPKIRSNTESITE